MIDGWGDVEVSPSIDVDGSREEQDAFLEASNSGY
jgi:hypothetical protein